MCENARNVGKHLFLNYMSCCEFGFAQSKKEKTVFYVIDET